MYQRPPPGNGPSGGGGGGGGGGARQPSGGGGYLNVNGGGGDGSIFSSADGLQNLAKSRSVRTAPPHLNPPHHNMPRSVLYRFLPRELPNLVEHVGGDHARSRRNNAPTSAGSAHCVLLCAAEEVASCERRLRAVPEPCTVPPLKLAVPTRGD